MGEINLKTVNIKLDKIESDVLAIEGITSQYAKSGTAVAEIGQACSWALELNTDFAPPTTTEIEPGLYDIDQIRGSVTTSIVSGAAASESVGTIYALYTPTEPVWNVGDLIKVTFYGGYIRTDQEPTITLTTDAVAGNTFIIVPDSDLFLAGWLIRLYDAATLNTEWLTITDIPDGITLNLSGALANSYTVANGGVVTRSIRYDLTSAVFFTMLQSEAQSYKIIGTGVLDTSSTTAPADSTRTEGDDYFNGSWLMIVDGTVANAINQPRLIVDYTGTGGIFTLDAEQPFTVAPGLTEYIIIGNNSQLTPSIDTDSNQTPAHVIGNKEDTIYDAGATAPTAYFPNDTSSLARYVKALLGMQGLCYWGIVTGGASVSGFTIQTLSGLGAGKFMDTIAPYQAFVFHADGAAPQGEMRDVTGYTDGTGAFTISPNFSVAVADGDEILILNPEIVNSGTFHEKAEVDNSVAVDNAADYSLFVSPMDFATTGMHYIIRNMTIKSDDPGAGQAITIKLIRNSYLDTGGLPVDTFFINSANYSQYFTLMDMFGIDSIVGDEIDIVATSTNAALTTVYALYSYAEANA